MQFGIDTLGNLKESLFTYGNCPMGFDQGGGYHPSILGANLFGLGVDS